MCEQAGMKSSFLKIILLLQITQGYAQGFDIDPKNWANGHIILTNGDSISGSVYFHKEKQTLYFDEDQETRAFKAGKVLKFDYYDSARNARRFFISILFRKTRTSDVKPEFLEVMREFEDFIMLTRFSSRKVLIPRNKYTSPQTITALVEDWYLTDDTGSLNLYFSMIHRDLFGPKVEFFNAALFKKISEPYKNEVKEFSSANKLKFQKPADNLKLLDYMDELSRASK